MTAALPRLSELTHEDARRLAVELGVKAFHGDELWRWIVKRFTLAPARMTNLPASFRAALETRFDPRPSRAVAAENDARSTTEKLLQIGRAHV